MTEIKKALTTLFSDRDTFEVRIPKAKSKRVISGYFNDVAKASEKIQKLDADDFGFEGVYVTINPVVDALLARASNTAKGYAQQTTSDADIKCRRWLPIDLDAVRPAGISASEPEKEKTFDRAGEVKKALAAAGWPEPVEADSGNGAHLLYRIDLPNNQDATNLVQNVLKSLDMLFTDGMVKVDQGVYNAARIWKCYGTHARKGDSTEDRPHRMARLMLVPKSIKTVTEGQLQALADMMPEPVKSDSVAMNDSAFDLQDFVALHGLEHEPPKDIAAGTLYTLKECPFNTDHGRDSWILRLDSGALKFRCWHDSCSGNDWQALREKFEPGYRDRQASFSWSTPEDDFATGGEQADGDDGVIVTWYEKGRGGLKFHPMLLAEHIAENHPCFNVGGRFYFYDGGCYVRQSRAGAVARVAKFLMKKHGRRNHVIDTLEFLAGKVERQPEEINSTHYINIKNGLLNPVLMDVQPHDPAVLSTIQLKVKYNPDAECSNFMEYLASSLPKETHAMAQEVAGYALSNYAKAKKLFLLVGPRDSGKSQFINILERFIPESNRTALTWQQLSEKFSRVQLFGSVLNTFADLPDAVIKDSDAVKALLGEDTIQAEYKGGDHISFKCQATIIFSANRLPRLTGDRTMNFFTKIAILEFPNIIPKKEQKDIKAATSEEMEGIFAWAMSGLERLIRNGFEFTTPERSKDLLIEYSRTANPIYLFLDETCEWDPTACVPRSRLWEEYRRWYEDSGMGRMGKREFYHGMRFIEGITEEQHPVTRIWVWNGIKLQNSDFDQGSRHLSLVKAMPWED